MDVREFFMKMFMHGVKDHIYQQIEEDRIFSGPIVDFQVNADGVVFQMKFLLKHDRADGEGVDWLNLPAILKYEDISDCEISGGCDNVFDFKHANYGNFTIREL